MFGIFILYHISDTDLIQRSYYFKKYREKKKDISLQTVEITTRALYQKRMVIGRDLIKRQ